MKCSKDFIINLACILPGVQQIVGAGGVLVGLFKGLWDTGAEIKTTCWNKKACNMKNLKKDGETLGLGVMRFIPIIGTIGSIILAVKTYKKDKANEKPKTYNTTDDVVETKKTETTPNTYVKNILKTLKEQSFEFEASDLDNRGSVKSEKTTKWEEGKGVKNSDTFLFAKNKSSESKNTYHLVIGWAADIIINYDAENQCFNYKYEGKQAKSGSIPISDINSDDMVEFASQIFKAVALEPTNPLMISPN